MPARAKIADVSQFRRWYEEGRTFEWMAAEHERLHNVRVTPSAFSNLRHRLGLERRFTRDIDLMPWDVRPEHRWRYAPTMLRAEARIRQGKELDAQAKRKLGTWLSRLQREGLVVDYDPEEGFSYVAREESDTDIVRIPLTKRTGRKPRS